MKDNFSRQSGVYALYRPTYPSAIYNHLYRRTRAFELACDCATGNGQVAYILAKRFKKVFACDISMMQLNHAVRSDNIEYYQSKAESLPLPPASVDLITVAQALHWLDPSSFFKEMQRIGKPGGLLAYWGYSLPTVSPAVDALLHDFHDHVVGPYWDAERSILDNEYRDISFPLHKIQHKNFSCLVSWSPEHMIGYLNSWSSVQHYIRENGVNPVDDIAIALKKQWIDNQQVLFPVFLTSGFLT